MSHLQSQPRKVAICGFQAGFLCVTTLAGLDSEFCLMNVRIKDVQVCTTTHHLSNDPTTTKPPWCPGALYL